MKLPAGTALHSIAKAMAEHVVDWYATAHAFFDEDLQHLIELGIPEADAAVLLSEYLIITMDRMFLLRQNLMEFSMGDDQVDYQTRCLWVSLQVHQELDALTTNGLHYNSSLSATFIHFLTVQTGKNVAVSIGPKLDELESKAKKQRSELTEFKLRVSLASGDVPKLRNDVDLLKKK